MTENFSRQVFDRFSLALDELKSQENLAQRIGIYSRITRAELATLLTTAFWASLTPEEGAYSNLRISFGPPNESESDFVFLQPQDYSPEQLSDLAPALVNTRRTIGVWYSESAKLQIWGWAHTPYWDVSITATMPGQLVFSMLAPENGFKLAVSGSWSGILDRTRTPLYWAYLGGSEPSLVGLEELEILGRSMMREGSYEWIVRGMLEHNHGGTLIIIPENNKVWRNCCAIRYESVSPFEELRNNTECWEHEIKKGVADGQWFSSSDFNRQRVEESSKMVAQLTAVDGATIIGRDLEVYGFGAKLAPRNSQLKPGKVLRSTLFEGAPYDQVTMTALGGTRHQSAAQFVYDHPGCFAIVCSQDGRVSSMHWDSDRGAVVVITNLEYSL